MGAFAAWGMAAGAAFLIGSLPWGLWIGKLVRGIDVRRHGSGNLGATNVYRVLGPRWGITVLLLDAAKGVAAVLVARFLIGLAAGGDSLPTGGAAATSVAASSATSASSAVSASGTAAQWAGLIALAASILGHSFSPFAGFRGGKGVATAAGAWGALAPLPLAIALGVFAAIFAATRIVSAGSLAAAAFFPVAVALLGAGEPGRGANPLLWFAVLTAILIAARHRANLRRLLRREERPLDLRGGGRR